MYVITEIIYDFLDTRRLLFSLALALQHVPFVPTTLDQAISWQDSLAESESTLIS